MAEIPIPQQRGGEDSEAMVQRIGELDIAPRIDGSPAPLRQELDEQFGAGGWGTREVWPEGWAEGLYHNMGYAVLEIYRK